MNKIIYSLLAFILLLVGFFAFNSYIYHEKQGDEGSPISQALTTYNSEVMGVSFDYLVGTEGYTLIKPENMDDGSSDFVDGVALLRTADYEDIQSGPDRGGPPAINVRAFNAPDTELIEWLEANSNFTNYQPDQSEPITIGDVEGIEYSWEGMFSGETAAVLYRGRVYMFDGTYSEKGDQRQADFRDILETVSFATPERLNVTGTYDCIDENAVINPPSESCLRGIRTTDGMTYSLDFMLMSQTLPQIQTGETITVSGVFTPTERLSASQWSELDVEGILSATAITKEAE
jgi:hypothetical protein